MNITHAGNFMRTIPSATKPAIVIHVLLPFGIWITCHLIWGLQHATFFSFGLSQHRVFEVRDYRKWFTIGIFCVALTRVRSVTTAVYKSSSICVTFHNCCHPVAILQRFLCPHHHWNSVLFCWYGQWFLMGVGVCILVWSLSCDHFDSLRQGSSNF